MNEKELLEVYEHLEEIQFELLQDFIHYCIRTHTDIEDITDKELRDLVQYLGMCRCARDNQKYQEYKVQECQKIHQCDAQCDECVTFPRTYTGPRNNSVRGNADDVF